MFSESPSPRQFRHVKLTMRKGGMTQIYKLMTQINKLMTQIYKLMTQIYKLMTQIYKLMTQIYKLMTQIYKLIQLFPINMFSAEHVIIVTSFLCKFYYKIG